MAPNMESGTNTLTTLHMGAIDMAMPLSAASALVLESYLHVGDCQNYGPFLGSYYNTGPNTGPNLGDPKRDHNFDNPPCTDVV